MHLKIMHTLCTHYFLVYFQNKSSGIFSISTGVCEKSFAGLPLLGFKSLISCFFATRIIVVLWIPNSSEICAGVHRGDCWLIIATLPPDYVV